MDSHIWKKIEDVKQRLSLRSNFTFPNLDSISLIEVLRGEKKAVSQLSIANHSNQSNYILIEKDQEKLGKATINFCGDEGNNIIIIGKNLELNGKIFCKGNHNTIVLSGSNIQPLQLSIEMLDAHNCLFFWGKESTSSAPNKIIMRGEANNCLIGDQCMFAYNIVLRTSDMHAIFDLESGQKINHSGDIVIESHVWVSQDVLILKKSTIGFGTIIGAKSLVTGNIPCCCVAGGVPAKVIRNNCSWDRTDHVRAETLEYVLKNKSDH